MRLKRQRSMEQEKENEKGSSGPRPAGAEAADGARNKEEEKEKGKGSAGPRPAGAAAAVGYVLVEDADALDCGVCYNPLKPPSSRVVAGTSTFVSFLNQSFSREVNKKQVGEIGLCWQLHSHRKCNEGHVVCSSCRDKLAPAGKCHVYGTATSKYHRCHAMERLVESIRVPCPNAAYGCNTRPAYYNNHDHCKTCPYAPYHCPSKECSFLGSRDALLDHFTGAHGWPSIVKIDLFEKHSICLCDGFNFLLADSAEDDNHGSTTPTISSSKYLFLLNVTRQSLGRAITMHLIGQQSPSEILRCVFSYSLILYDPCERHKFLASHSLQSEINVECMDASNGPPDPADCFHFVVPDSILGDKNKEDPVKVNVCISIINL